MDLISYLQKKGHLAADFALPQASAQSYETAQRAYNQQLQAYVREAIPVLIQPREKVERSEQFDAADELVETMPAPAPEDNPTE